MIARRVPPGLLFQILSEFSHVTVMLLPERSELGSFAQGLPYAFDVQIGDDNRSWSLIEELEGRLRRKPPH